MESLALLATIISIANIALLFTLIMTYLKIYKTGKAVYTLGLLFFAAILMLHNIIAVYAYIVMAPLYSNELLPYFVAIHLAELVGIAALVKVTLD